MTDINEYFIKSINTSIATRKIKKIIIIEENKIFNPRPQTHTMVISPFGTAKSTGMEQKICELIGDDAVYREKFTEPAFLGTISRQNQFVSGIVWNLGGKVLVIDEWNSVRYEAQDSLLSILENQKVSRQLGYNVKRRKGFKNEYSDLKVVNNLIEGKCQFSAIVFAMSFTARRLKSLALLSRFSPVFLNPDKNEIKEILKGIKTYDFKDYSRPIENITVPKEVWNKFIDEIYEHLNKTETYPKEKGFVTRATTEALRFGILDLLKETDGNELILDNPETLIKQIPFLDKQLEMFQRAKTTIDKLKEFMLEYPEQSNVFYADKLHVSKQFIGKLMKELKEEGFYGK